VGKYLPKRSKTVRAMSPRHCVRNSFRVIPHPAVRLYRVVARGCLDYHKSMEMVAECEPGREDVSRRSALCLWHWPLAGVNLSKTPHPLRTVGAST